jgi:3-methylcrotonyl-CoA carboxylase beta subunit
MHYSQVLLRRPGLWTYSFKHLLPVAVPGHRVGAYHAASVLPSLVSPSSPDFQARAKAMDQVVADLDAKLAAAREGGGAKAAERMRSKGKKLPRERYRTVFSLSDPEISLTTQHSHLYIRTAPTWPSCLGWLYS